LARSNAITTETGAQRFFAQIGHGIVKVSLTVKTQIDFKGTPALVGEPITGGESGARRLGHRKLEPYVTG
jgi:hypothetical protein